MPKETIFLFTKKFPFGHQETYLFNELPYLVKSFDQVIIIPYDEFEYTENANRIKEDESLKILRINKINNPLGFFGKLKRELMVWKILSYELMKGREPANHFKYRKRNLSQLRQSYNNALSLKHFITQHSFEHIILYNYWLHGGIIISGLLNKLSKPVEYPVVSRAHAYDVYHKDWYTLYPGSSYLFLGFEKWKVFNTDKIYPISTHALNHFHNLFPQLKEKFEISRLGVLEHQRVDNPVQAEELVLVSCSNINDNKRIDRIPEIISYIDKKVKWFHFGKGSDSDTAKVKQEIEKYNLENSCQLMGFKPNAEVIDFYKTNRVDLFLNLSQIEGIPVSLMEAASFGIPMLATKTIGNPEIVNEENGFLVEIDFDARQIADGLTAYFKDERAVSNKREASYQTFLQKYNASINYPHFIEHIKNIKHVVN